MGFTALVNGALAFWFVDGLLYAIKDTVAALVFTAVFGGSLLVCRPVLRPMFAQVAGADTPERRDALYRLLDEPRAWRAVIFATALVTALSAALAVLNLALNLGIVTASFGTEAFNGQVARVNAITRVTFPLATAAGFFGAFWIVFRAVYGLLLGGRGTGPDGPDLWGLVAEREARLGVKAIDRLDALLSLW